MATNSVKLNDKWNMAPNQQQQQPANNYGQPYVSQASRGRTPSKGKNKYTLAPIDHQKSMQKMGNNSSQMMLQQQMHTPSHLQPLQGNHSYQNIMNPQMAPSYGNSPMVPYQGGVLNINHSGSKQQPSSFRSGQMINQSPMPQQPQWMNSGMMMPYQNSGQFQGGMYMNQMMMGGQQHFTPMKQSMNPREFEMELSGIRSVDEVSIDHTSVLAIKRGDLAIIQGEVFKCCPSAPHLRDIPLVLKRLDCVDRRIYDLKVYELDTFMRFRGHPNIISLYSYWSEKPSSPYQYKSLVCLYEEALLGDMLKTIVLNPVRPSNRLAMKYLCDISKGLASLNNCNIIHGSIKPSSIYIQSDNTAMIGELGKVELDSARHTHQLFSKVLIQDAMPHTLVYWAPEVLRLERYSTAADMWALGISMYQLVTGEHPFNVTDEESFRDDLFSANVDWSRIAGYPRLKIIVENLIRVDPYKRWDSNMVLAYAQESFVIEIQRVWRGFLQRREFQRKCRGLRMIQAHIKGFVTKMRYRTDKVYRKDNAVVKIQARFRAYIQRKKFIKIKHAFMRCQANVLTRQYRRAYLKMRSDVQTAQQYIKRFHAMLWYSRIKESKEQLENHIESINEMISKFNVDASQFKNQFAGKEITKPLEYLGNFEQYEIIKAKRGMIEQSHVPKLHHLTNEYEKLLEENKKLQEGQYQNNNQDPLLALMPDLSSDSDLKQQLGDKYYELGDMVSQLKDNLLRVAQQAKHAQPLQIKIQHPYQYSKWDSIHEPYNVVENVLKDDESVYKALTPALDFTMGGGSLCFVAEVVLYPGDCGPAQVEIYVSNTIDKWTFVKQYNCTKTGAQKLIIPGEHICKYLRIRCINNIRGGNLVNVRYVTVKGIVKNPM